MITLFSGLMDLVFPRICLECNNKPDKNECFCEDCLSDLYFIMEDDLKVIYEKKFSKTQSIDSLFSLFYFVDNSISQKIIHSIKYQGFRKLGIDFGQKLGEKLKVMDLKADYIIPVPLHRTRKRERGYNQSELICQGIGNITNITLNSKILKREKYTLSQTNLNHNERISNVTNAFIKNNRIENDLNDKKVFLVDDVITTGSTIVSCAKVLKAAGVRHITALSLACVN